MQTDEFVRRVQERAGIRRLHAVMSVLHEAISAGSLQKIRRQRPAEYEELFTGEPYGPESPAALVEEPD